MEQSHCGYCGARFTIPKGWPRTCTHCGKSTWKNPLPAVMLLVVVNRAGEPDGVLCVRRGIEPGKGKLALPGGFIEVGETWREAAVRELQEETGLSLTEDILLYRVADGTKRDRILIFGVTKIRGSLEKHIVNFEPNPEVTELIVIRKPQELAFTQHTDVVSDFWEKYLNDPFASERFTSDPLSGEEKEKGHSYVAEPLVPE